MGKATPTKSKAAPKKAAPKKAAPKKAAPKKAAVKKKPSHAAGDLPVNSFELDESDYSPRIYFPNE